MKLDPTFLPRLRQLSRRLETIELARKWNPATQQWEEAEMDPIGNHPVATAAATGAVGAGYLAHRSILKNYGGEGGVGQAYRNVGRNIGRNADDMLRESKQRLAVASKSAVAATTDAAGGLVKKVAPYAQDALGVAKSEGGMALKTATPFVQDALGVAKSEGGALLKKLRGALPFLAGAQIDRLVELSAGLEFGAGKNFRGALKAVAKKKLPIARGVAAGAVAGGAAAGISAMIAHHAKKQRTWAENAGPHDVLKIGNDLYIDRHGAMYPGNHPRVKQGKVTEMSA